MPPQQLRAGSTTHTLHALPYGDAGVRVTLRKMRELTREWRKHPMIRDLAVQLTAGCPPKHWPCEIRKLHEFVRDRIRYVADIADVETLATPQQTLKLRAGDCDDKCILLASLLQAVGHPARFVAVAFSAGAPLSHVFVETKLGAYWVACETTEPWPVGRRPPGIRRYVIEAV